MRTGQIPEHRPDGKHIVPVEPDAVTFTAMIMACAYRDDFEQSRALLLDMKQSALESTLSVHNALINACASRAHSLANLGKAKKHQLQRLKVETDPAVALLKATQQLGQLEDEGHAPDGYTYLALLRCCAGAGEVARAQRLLSRMLDTGVAPNELHFDALLRACARAQWIKRSDQWNDHLKAAASVPPSMVELGLEVSEPTLDLVVETYARCCASRWCSRRSRRLYDSYGLTPHPARSRTATRCGWPNSAAGARAPCSRRWASSASRSPRSSRARWNASRRGASSRRRARRGWRGRRSAGTSRRRRRSGDKGSRRSGAASTAAARAPSSGGRGGWRGEISLGAFVISSWLAGGDPDLEVRSSQITKTR